MGAKFTNEVNKSNGVNFEAHSLDSAVLPPVSQNLIVTPEYSPRNSKLEFIMVISGGPIPNGRYQVEYLDNSGRVMKGGEFHGSFSTSREKPGFRVRFTSDFPQGASRARLTLYNLDEQKAVSFDVVLRNSKEA